MNQNEERNTTELEIGQETNTSGSGRGGQKPSTGNSFYERKNNEEKTVWYKDWRGKTLGITLAALVLIGGGIPAGMAAAGYWADFKGKETPVLDGGDEINDIYEEAMDRIAILENKALLDHYQMMVYEGLVTPKAHDNAIEDAEDNADDAIKSEKDALKDQYGNTWKDEWDKDLQEKGFSTGEQGEQEYKDSIVASSIKGNITAVYSSARNIKTKVLETDSTVYTYESEINNGKKYVIKNSYEYPAAGDEEWYDNNNNKYSYTPTDLMTAYLTTFEPVMFNDTLLPFIPVVGNGAEADIQGNNISMTNSDINAAWSFARMDTYEPAALNYGGIQSKGSIDFSAQSLGQEANIAVMSGLNGSATDGGTTIKTLVDNAFSAALPGQTSATVTSNMITNMNDDEVNLFEETLRDDLIAAGLLNDPDNAAKPYRNWSTSGIVDANTYSFVSTNGLHNIGVQFDGVELVTEQLNSDIGEDALDVGLFASFNTWFSTAFEYITLIDYLTDPVDAGQGWFDASGALAIQVNENVISSAAKEDIEVSNEEMIIAYFSDFAQSRIKSTTDAYEAGKSFAKTNWKQYNSDEYSTTAGLDIITYINSTNLNGLAGQYLNTLAGYSTATKTIDNKRGDE